MAAANLSRAFPGGYCVPRFPASGVWREWTRSYDLLAADGVPTLGPFEAQVFVS